MQIWGFSNTTLILVNILAWFILHMSFAWFITQLPLKWFNPDSWFFQLKTWEQNGRLYQTLFRVKNWKKRLPDGASLFKKGFKKKTLHSRDIQYLQRFEQETCRGEMAHWLVFGISPVFFLWNTLSIGWVMIGYALLANLPCIVVQRFNRPFIRRLIKNQRKQRKEP